MPFGTGEYQRIDQRPANNQLTNDQQGSPLTYASTFHQRRKVQKKPSVSFNLETFVRNHIDNCSTSNSLSCSAFSRFPSQGCQYMVWQYIYIYSIYILYIFIYIYIIYIVTQDNSSLREPKQPKMIQDVFSSKSSDECHLLVILGNIRNCRIAALLNMLKRPAYVEISMKYLPHIISIQI